MDILENALCGAGKLPKDEVLRRNPLILAYIGDTVYDLLTRLRLIADNPNESVHALHMRAIRIVNAKAQAEALDKVYEQLTDEEKDVFRRGRNAKPGTVPKNADVGDYHRATGFEAVLGFLYLCGERERLLEIYGMTVGKEDS